jgi:XRE family transcriptional regulator, fatty acid utilization regulator
LTLRDVEAKTGIGQSSLSEYESGKRVPRLSQLQSLAEVYRRSLGFLLGEGEIPRELVLWRQQPEGPAASEIQATFLRLAEQYHNLEVWCEDCRTCVLPSAGGKAEAYRYADAEGLAKRVRSVLDLGERPGQELLRVLEEVCGVKVFHLPFEPTGSAACTVHETYGPAILLNSNAVRWRRNFDLAHELFHILTWPIFRGSAVGDGVTPSDQEEKFATYFAGNLLMPIETVRQAIEAKRRDGKLAYKDLFDIARQFDVSVEALLWRMRFLYNTPEAEIVENIRRYKATGQVWEADREYDTPPRRPLRFQALAVQSLREGKMSQGKFAEYMGISRREAIRFVEQEAPEDEAITLPFA